MRENKLKIKDLVTIGVFAVIYFVVMFGVGMIGMVPILFLVYPTLLGIVTESLCYLCRRYKNLGRYLYLVCFHHY